MNPFKDKFLNKLLSEYFAKHSCDFSFNSSQTVLFRILVAISIFGTIHFLVLFIFWYYSFFGTIHFLVLLIFWYYSFFGTIHFLVLFIFSSSCWDGWVQYKKLAKPVYFWRLKVHFSQGSTCPSLEGLSWAMDRNLTQIINRLWDIKKNKKKHKKTSTSKNKQVTSELSRAHYFSIKALIIILLEPPSAKEIQWFYIISIH